MASPPDKKLTNVDPARRNKMARPLTAEEWKLLEESADEIRYSNRYSDDDYDYRHVKVPEEMLKQIPDDYIDRDGGTLKLLWEEEWRSLGIIQSHGWEHYEVHAPEPHILLFRRPINPR